MAFASVADLRVYAALPDLDTAQAQLALDLATGLIRNQARQTISYVASDPYTVASPGQTWTLALPEHPVLSVASVLVRPVGVGGEPALTLTTSEWALLGGAVLLTMNRWSAYDAATITYSHGFETIPDDLKAVTLGAAMRAVTNPNGLRGEQLGSYSYTLAGDIGGSGLTEYETAVCRRYRLHTYSMVR